MPRHSALPPPIADRVFATAEARRLGVSVRRLRGSDLTSPFPAVRATGLLPVAHADVIAAYAARMPPEQFFSHWSAAVLLGLRLPEREVPSRLDIAVLGAARLPRLRGIRGHQLLPSARIIELSGGIRVSDPVDTWCQLAAELSVDDLIVMGDGLVSRQHPIATIGTLELAVEAWGHRPGVTALRRAIPEIRARTDSSRETTLRLFAVRAGFPEPVVNHPILNRYGAFIGFGDLAYPEYKVLLEYDGRPHWESARQFARDIARLDEFMEEDWRVIRVDKVLMAQRAVLRGKIRDALSSRGWIAP